LAQQQLAALLAQPLELVAQRLEPPLGPLAQRLEPPPVASQPVVVVVEQLPAALAVVVGAALGF
jgi:hypothetical protein